MTAYVPRTTGPFTLRGDEASRTELRGWFLAARGVGVYDTTYLYAAISSSTSCQDKKGGLMVNSPTGRWEDLLRPLIFLPGVEYLTFHLNF